MAHPISISSLTPREAIADALYRAILGFDRNDETLLESACAGEDISFEIRVDGQVAQSASGFSNIKKTVFALVGPMDTTHTLSNIRIDVKDGADTAHVATTAVAQHCPPGQGKVPDAPKLLVGGQYLVDVVKDKKDGLWKIKKWVLEVIWRQGDASVMEPPK